MEIFENNMSRCCSEDDMIMPYPPMHGADPYPYPMPMPCPYPMPGHGPMPMPEPMPGHGPMPMPMPMPMPGHGPMPMPMPCPHPMPMPMPCPHPMPMPMPCPHPMPMPMPMPMPIEDCDEETLHHMEKMYCMHMYMAAMNKTEAYKHKMMHCYCKHHMDDH